ncbi:hypothetical protein ABFT80_07615 [Mesorhizobium sp. SB112]|uniref:hypothetical protein n=1 Tax=Mesorhizobium sp. SB112 TaxID=3151853 RepID=UPI0032643F28
MIVFEKKLPPPPAPKNADEKTPAPIRDREAERRVKADTDGTRRRAKQVAEDNRLL